MSTSPALSLSTTPLAEAKVDLIIAPVFEGALAEEGAIAALLGELVGGARDIAAREKFTGKAGQRLALPTFGKLPAGEILLAGLGKADEATLASFRDAVAEGVRGARRAGQGAVAVGLPEGIDGAARAGAEGAVLGNYRFDRYLSKKDDDTDVGGVEVVSFHGEGEADAIALGAAIAEATNHARDLVNEPAGAMHPESLAAFAQELAEAHGLEFEVHQGEALEALRFGMMTAVGRASQYAPRMIVLKYRPEGKDTGPGVAFVGKGVTFDAGGYDLKPAAAMLDMKMDMGGSAAALSAMRAVAAIKPPFAVTAYVGAVENLVSGDAYKPGDILTSRKGTTVEVNNTDAEGRLVIGDVLTYASEQGHEAIIDLATLTGACMVALGPYTVGGFSNDDTLAEAVLGASKEAGEDIWRMPLNHALKEQLKSDIADMRNTGERFGGAITAALFLEHFVGETPWMHLDIAGPAMIGRDRGADRKGATGVGVRTLAQWILNRAS